MGRPIVNGEPLSGKVYIRPFQGLTSWGTEGKTHPIFLESLLTHMEFSHRPYPPPQDGPHRRRNPNFTETSSNYPGSRPRFLSVSVSTQSPPYVLGNPSFRSDTLHLGSYMLWKEHVVSTCHVKDLHSSRVRLSETVFGPSQFWTYIVFWDCPSVPLKGVSKKKCVVWVGVEAPIWSNFRFSMWKMDFRDKGCNVV